MTGPRPPSPSQNPCCGIVCMALYRREARSESSLEGTLKSPGALIPLPTWQGVWDLWWGGKPLGSRAPLHSLQEPCSRPCSIRGKGIRVVAARQYAAAAQEIGNACRSI